MAGTTLGNAYVQIIPSAKGIKGSIEKELSGEAQSAGTSVGTTIASFAKIAIVAAGIGKVFSMALTEGGNLQQSLGGIETLFKDSADTMKGYASEAFQSAGLSANEYMETATSFAASLVSSLGGNTEEAAKIANMAIIDMSDNANKMGTDMQSIQNAYQGFAKQNYTMLDNLKLGYGGTKTEMERLLADAEKLTGIKYDINNLSDVYSAIHVIQTELGITGTTAQEASETLTGSFNMMKASFKDFLGALSGEGVTSIQESVNNMSDSVATFLSNLIPMVGTILLQLPEAVAGALAGIGTKFIEMTQDPQFAESGAELVKQLVLGIINAIPDLILGIASLGGAVISSIALIGGELLQQGWDWITNLASGIWQGVESDLQAAWQGMKDSISQWLEGIWQNIVSKFESIKQTFSTAWESCKTIITTVWDAIKNAVQTAIDTVKVVIESVWNTIKGVTESVWNGIKSAIETPMENAKNFVKGIIDAIKGFFDFDIHWPHIPLPHFSISPSGWGIHDLLESGTIPSLGIEWYAKGGIFDKASVIGVGEAGSEAAVPLDPFWKKLESIETNIVDGVTNAIVNAINEVNITVNTEIDGKTIAKTTAEFIDRKLGRMQSLASRGTA